MRNMDKKLEEIQGLTWLPWIGKEYFSCSDPIMVIGESHYVHDNYTPDKIDSEPGYTREVLNEYVENGREGGNQWTMYESIEKILRDICFENNRCRTEIWNSIAYMNIIQHAQCEKSGKKKWEDFLSGWKVVLQVVNVLKPRIVVCFSTDKALNRVNFNRLPEFREDISFSYCIKSTGDAGEKIGGTGIATPGSIKIGESGTPIPVIFLQHASRIKQFDAWQKVLQQYLPNGFIIR